MPTDLAPGTRFVAKRGQHMGRMVEVIRTTARGDRVIVRPVEGIGRNAGKGAFDNATRWTLDVDQLVGLHAEYSSPMDPIATQPAYRRLSPKRVARLNGAVEEPPQEVLLAPTPEGMSVSLTTITPLMAQAWLDRGGLNRHLNPHSVENLAAAIGRGEWLVTGDTIKLDAEGRVRDGQHRLEAVVASQTPIRSLVVYGVDERAFDVMDTGRSRSIADVLGMRGYPDRNSLASAVRNLIMYDTTGRLEPSTRESRRITTSVATLDYLRSHPEVQEAVRKAEAVRRDLTGSAGLWASIVVILSRVDSDASEVFLDKLLTGANLDKGDPILVLRNRLASTSRNRDYWFIRSHGDREALAASVIKTWNAWRKGEQMDSWRAIHWRSEGRSAEAFPTPA